MILGTFLVTNVPLTLNSAWNRQDARSKLDDEVETWDDWAVIKEGRKSRKLQYYHHIIDQAREADNCEDRYKEYVWKVDKVVSHKKERQTIFLQSSGNLVIRVEYL